MVAALVQEREQVNARHAGARKALLLDMLAEAGRNPALAKILQQNSRCARTLLADLMRKGQEQNRVDPGLDPELAATILIGVMDGSKTMV
ncbi:TetR family transcriptional regulator C-terminal domain-containing protein [Acidisoma cellulosilytica]|uniref:TetR family transcriptional regulator C-terminal domain-containing protein n=1 Tax=Acidisoma cellulosilyticum TaxID=2802395 RepID=A0A963Z5C3_9PROT|nr:TetR family transcriptional regulator C-terminal domain-containing protein [Acidisoma cellulosilyticum]MCB8882973.1 TetR family transcriptional regulator C-terminal domain-containing protein [Acidisoma cellulosilyticum]